MPEDAPLAAAIQPGGVVQGPGDGQEVLPQQEGAEGRTQVGIGHDQAPIAVQPAELLHDHEQRHDQHLGRDHHGREEDIEQGVAASELQPSESVGGQRAEGQLQGHHPAGDDHAVDREAPHRQLAEGGHVRVVLGMPATQHGGVRIRTEQLIHRRGLVVRVVQRGQTHPHEGDHRGHCDDRQQQVGAQQPQLAAPGTRSCFKGRPGSLHETVSSRRPRRMMANCTMATARIIPNRTYDWAEAMPTW